LNNSAFSIYDASAGSGKTFTLVKEYLKIILKSSKEDAYKNILAITFTNKAVGEMKSRIVDNLSEFAKDTPNNKALDMLFIISEEIGLSQKEIANKSKSIIKNIIHNYAAFDISTIDKFTHKVIKTFAHDLNLSSTFEISLETDMLLQEAVDAILAQAGEDKVLTKLLLNFTMEKADDDKSWDISREILEVGKLINNENNRNEIIHFQNKSIEEFIEIKSKLAESCKVLEKETIVFAEEALLLIEKTGIDTKSFSAGHFPNHLQSIQEGKFNPENKTYHEFDDIKINKTAKDRDLIEVIIPELLQILDKIYKIFEKRGFYKAFLKNITPLSLLNTINNELAKIQKEKNILSIAEFNTIIHNEIQNQPAPFIYERMGEKYRRFFIDEFQDTSQMQWENLIPLIDNATASEDLSGEKGSLMIVGDPKQSIYRWRGGKAEQFIELSKENNPFANPDKQLFSLDTNYRSYSEVIDFNNSFFNLISGKFSNNDYKNLYANKSFQKQNDKKGGFVNISFVPKSKDILEDEDVSQEELFLIETINTINKVLLEGFNYKDIVILTRKKAHGVLVANYLTELNIPIVSSETLLIENASEVKLIINVLKFLKNENNIEAKALFLQYISTKIQSKMPSHDFIVTGLSFKKEKEFEQWLQTLDVTISFTNIRKKALYETIEIIISKFINLKNTNAYVQYFLDIVLEKDVKLQYGVSDFIDFWDKNSHKFSIPSPEGNNAIRIMTIHKSKGLEFPVVIFPFAEEKYSSGPKDKLWIDSTDTDVDLPKFLIDNNKSVENFGEIASRIYLQKKQEELLDNVNILYVALTRAEEQLYIISSLTLNKENNAVDNTMSMFFIEYLQAKKVFDPTVLTYSFGLPQKVSKNKENRNFIKPIPVLENAFNPEAIQIAKKESLMWGTLQQEAIEYGNLIHEILSYIQNANDVDIAITKALENGLISNSQTAVITKEINKILNHPELNVFFEPHNKVYNEQAIIQNQGGILKPDRVVINNLNQALILDYKTGKQLDKHNKQLQVYEAALNKMNFQVIKKTLVYIGKTIDIVNL